MFPEYLEYITKKLFQIAIAHGREVGADGSATELIGHAPLAAGRHADVSEVLLSDNADKTIVAAGIKALYGTPFAYNS